MSYEIQRRNLTVQVYDQAGIVNRALEITAPITDIDAQVEAAEAAADRAEAAASVFFDTVAEAQANTVWIDGRTYNVAGVDYTWTNADVSASVTASDPRYIAPDSDATGASGGLVMTGSVWDGNYSRSEGHKPFRRAGRLFLGANAEFGGEWSGAASMTGLNATAKGLHNWAFRDGGMVYDDHAGSMAIVGHSQSSREGEWPGSPSFNPASIGVSGFAINDAPAGSNPAWGLYGDAVRLNDGFTVGAELTVANASGEGSAPNPYNMKTGGAQAGVTAWLATGCGLDVAWPEYDRISHTSAFEVFLSSYKDDGGTVAWANGQAYIVGRAANDGATAYVCLVSNTAPSSGTFADYRTANPSHWALRKSGAWAFSTAYNVGDLAVDAVSGNTFRCLVAHTSPGSGAFSSYRAANTTHWKQNPSAKTGKVVARGAIAENAAGSDLYPVMDMPDRHQIRWWRDESGTPVLSAFIWSDRAPNGTPARGITFNANGVLVSGGIAVSNTDSSVATVLDHYLEAAPTLGLTIGGSETGITFSSRAMNTRRVGNMIEVQGSFTLSSKGAGSGAVAITGLPVAAVGFGGALSVGYYQNFAAGITSAPMGLTVGTTIALYKAGSATSTALQASDLTNTSRLDFSLSYRVA